VFSDIPDPASGGSGEATRPGPPCDVWDFDYRVGDEYAVFETEHGIVGLAMCSEAFMPEVPTVSQFRP
jgi:hypothetical protein